MKSSKQLLFVGALAVLAAGAFVIELFFPASPVSEVIRVIDSNYLGSALRLSVPIAFAALGGIFAEKSGVINIGLEGLLIGAAFTGVAVAHWLTGTSGGSGSVVPGILFLVVLVVLTLGSLIALGLLGDDIQESAVQAGAVLLAVLVVVALTMFLTPPGQTAVWLAFYAAILSSVLLALLFAVVTIEFRADQIIAGLAVWLIALGAAPFASYIIWGQINSPSVATMTQWTVPGLVEIPLLGPVLFDANPTVFMLLVAAPLAWYVLKETSFGYWVRASGENPKALDTAGIDVRRVRYGAVLLSGFLSGIGGAGLSLGQVGQFIGGGATMVDGRGWIGITAYLFGNYNPLGAFGASFLFAALDALQFRVQQLGYSLPPSLVQTIPYIAVIVVLALVGRTRIPDAAGEHYESGED
jgi:ABC-type uncharacterized transport system permease subunit